VVASAGAEVVQRHDPDRRGKGYALDFGVRHLEADAPDVVVIVDADCVVAAGAIDTLVRRCQRAGVAVQSLYLMQSPPDAGLKTRMAELAWIVKNHVRPLGFSRLELPCQLMGSGMAFPWEQLRCAPLASGHIVEDMQLGLDLAAAGTPPMFCAQAIVSSRFPSDDGGLATQRTRWEHGHLQLVFRAGLPLLWRAMVARRLALAAMALDLCVPPLASLVLGLVTWLMLTAVFWWISGAGAPLILAAAALSLFSSVVLVAWWRFGRSAVSLWELLSVPAYVLRKIPIYLKLLGKRQVEWVRTKRDDTRT
jgi:cellulose synthase/poly-beta-1,6-N-acetylglucosamine synthase-like glycosyltransferase